MVNDGSGGFRIERGRATDAVFRNSLYGYWQHVGHSFVDADGDGDPDLALGRIDGGRGVPSIVAVNDGTGHYPTRIVLPDLTFNEGWTAVHALARFDVNSDGLDDLLLVHERDGPPEALSFTGRYIQVLLNDGGTAFVDETSTWMGGQEKTTPERGPDGDPLHNAARPRMLDIDRDGCEDIVMANSNDRVRSESPIFYLNNGSGQFQAVDPGETFTGMGWSGIYGVPADVDGDGVVDLVFPQRVLGPDDEYGTDDDSTRFLTLMNTTPPRPVRSGGICGTSLPEVLEAATEDAAAQGDDGVGPGDGPAHAATCTSVRCATTRYLRSAARSSTWFMSDGIPAFHMIGGTWPGGSQTYPSRFSSSRATSRAPTSTPALARTSSMSRSEASSAPARNSGAVAMAAGSSFWFSNSR